MKPLALLVTLFIVIVPAVVFGQESVAVDPAPGMTLERWLILVGILVPVLGNPLIAWLRGRGSNRAADYLTAKFPLVLQVLAANKPREEASRVVGAEVTKLILNPSVPVTEQSPISVAARVLTDAPPPPAEVSK